MTEPVRIGLVGAGAIAQLTHLPVLGKMRGAKLVAVCDNDRPKARALADRFDIPDVYTDIEDLLESDEIQAVVIATPNHLHEPHVLSAIAAGKDVLCERPVALTARGAERMEQHLRRIGRFVGMKFVEQRIARMPRIECRRWTGSQVYMTGASSVATGLPSATSQTTMWPTLSAVARCRPSGEKVQAKSIEG